MDLGGTWAAIEATEERRRTYALTEGDADGEPWLDVQVPSHWRSHPALAGCDGPVLHRRRFAHGGLHAGQRAWLCFDGLFYLGDVWLDGAYVGNTEGYFSPHRFEVTEALAAARDDHLLAVEVGCSPQPDRRARRNLTGSFQHGDGIDVGWNPGGLWRPVRIEVSGPVRATRVEVLCTDADESRAVLRVRAELDTTEARTVEVRSVLTPARPGAAPVAEVLGEHPLAAGANQVTWTVPVDQPSLWWPRVLGEQPLYDLQVAVLVDGEESDRAQVRTGLRRLAFQGWKLSVNGEQLFLKGANQGPARRDLAAATPEELAADVRLAVDAGLDLLRLQAHVTRPEVYAAADAAGLLLWQDLPLQWSQARGVRGQAVRQARDAVALLGHHPSVAIWCGHDEPFGRDPTVGDAAARRKARRRVVLAQELPSWNRTVLDRSVKRALEKADGTRPVIAHSGVLPHLPDLDGTDSHLWLGWSRGDERDLPRLAARLPRLVRFVSEFGAQAVPADASFCEPGRWPDLDWDHLEAAHGMQPAVLRERVPPEDHPAFEPWVAATQRYQAQVVRRHVEELRRLKYRPTGGFAVSSFADAQPAVSFAVLDHERRPKAAFHALVEACRPVIVVADRLPAVVAPGDALALDVHVVSDLRVALEGCEVRAILRWEGGEHRWRWGGEVPADACVRVATLSIVVPEAPGPLTLELTCEAAGVHASNADVTRIEAPGA